VFEGWRSFGGGSEDCWRKVRGRFGAGRMRRWEEGWKRVGRGLEVGVGW
jgi:hypothetical protein